MTFKYHKNIPQIELNARKISPIFENLIFKEKKSIVLFGTSQSGKTAFIFYSFLQVNPEKYIYIDLYEHKNNLSNVFNSIISELNKNKKIEFLIIETYDFDILEELKYLKNLNATVVISTWLHDLTRDNFFHNLELFPLNFEEFLSFKPSNESLESALSRFFKIGTFPFLANKNDSFYTFQITRFLPFALSQIELIILENIANLIGTKVSFFAIFNNIKTNHKISKDKFYLAIKSLENKKYLLYLHEFNLSLDTQNIKKNVKKSYLIDPVIRNSFSGRKDFITLFENIIFLELIKKNKRVSFFEKIDFYIFDERRAILLLPFGEIEQIKKLLKKVEKSISKIFVSKIEILTLHFETNCKFNNKQIEVISFSRWALTE
jgi:GTPase SAR1 family protein